MLASLACTSQTVSISTPDSGFINTTIAQTVSAALIQTAQPGSTVTGLGSPTATQLPTLTPNRNPIANTHFYSHAGGSSDHSLSGDELPLRSWQGL